MNFLAHAYLSFNDQDILAGNMISDFVKGRKQYDYSAGIHRGIVLHRAIDNFTDSHPIVKKAKETFQSVYRLYSGAFIDIVFDHFLSIDKIEFPEKTLLDFTLLVYDRLDKSLPALPPAFQQLFPYMKQQNWLFNYRTAEGIERSFRGLVHRAKFLDESNSAINIFHEQYSFLNTCYNEFFPDLKSYARGVFNLLTSEPGTVSYQN
jgi:acyl carrier protein phosphodiesterase